MTQTETTARELRFDRFGVANYRGWRVVRTDNATPASYYIVSPDGRRSICISEYALWLWHIDSVCAAF